MAAIKANSSRGLLGIKNKPRGVTQAQAKAVVKRSRAAKQDAQQSKPAPQQSHEYVAMERGLPKSWSKRTQENDVAQKHSTRKSWGKLTQDEKHRWVNDPGYIDVVGADTPEALRRRDDHHKPAQREARRKAEVKFAEDWEKRKQSNGDNDYATVSPSRLRLGLDPPYRIAGDDYVVEEVAVKDYAGAPRFILHPKRGEPLFVVPNGPPDKTRQFVVVRRLGATRAEEVVILTKGGKLRLS